MIERRRSPDRPNDASQDVWHGGGPLGRRPSNRIGGTALADAVQPKKLRGLFLSNPGHTEYVKRWRRERDARTR